MSDFIVDKYKGQPAPEFLINNPELFKNATFIFESYQFLSYY